MTKNQYAEINSGYSEKKDPSTTMKHLLVKKALSKYSDPISYIILPIVFIGCIFISFIITIGLGILKLHILHLFPTISTSNFCSNTSVTSSLVKIYLFSSLVYLK